MFKTHSPEEAYIHFLKSKNQGASTTASSSTKYGDIGRGEKTFIRSRDSLSGLNRDAVEGGTIPQSAHPDAVALVTLPGSGEKVFYILRKMDRMAGLFSMVWVRDSIGFLDDVTAKNVGSTSMPMDLPATTEKGREILGINTRTSEAQSPFLTHSFTAHQIPQEVRSFASMYRNAKVLLYLSIQ